MNKLKSDFKVFVSDEILDFRTLEEKYGRPSSTINSLQRTHSQDAINFNRRKDITPPIRRQVTPSENTPKPLYNSTTTLADKFRYPRLKARSRTVDPRFRKSRSPTHKIISGSQSTADIINPPMSQAKKKPFSPNHLSVNREIRKPPRYTGDPSDNIVSPVNVQSNHPANKEHENHKFIVLDEQQEVCHEAIDEEKNSETEKYVLTSIGDACNISHPPEITEDDIMDESISQINAESTEGCPDKIPYWDDPRLLKKHNVMKPIRSQQIKNGLIVCRNCSTSQWITPEYKYDDQTEICNSSIITNGDFEDEQTNKKDEHSSLLKALGSILGILIVSLIVWCVTLCGSWDFNKLWPVTTNSPPPEASVLFYIRKYGENIFYWVDTLYSEVYEIILMPRSGILNDAPAREPNRWWWRN